MIIIIIIITYPNNEQQRKREEIYKLVFSVNDCFQHSKNDEFIRIHKLFCRLE